MFFMSIASDLALVLAFGGLIVQILYDSKRVAVSSWPAQLMPG